MDLENQFKQHRHSGADSLRIRFKDLEGDITDVITPSATILDPTGGAVIDVEARAAIDDILDILQAQGLME